LIRTSCTGYLQRASAVLDNQIELQRSQMVEDLIRRARRRFLFNETLAQSAFAAAVSIGGFALLLITGTRYLAWWPLTVLALGALAVGFYRVYKQTPDRYTTAVRLDENARLHDAISTAWYFSEHQTGSSEFRRSQRQQADALAGGVQLAQAVPFVVPRSFYAMAALFLLASGLVAIRYRIGRGLDLRAPITQFLFEDQAIRDAKNQRPLSAKGQKQWTDEAQSLLAKLGMAPNPNEPAPGDPDALDKAIDAALQNPDSNGKDPGGKGEKGGDPGKNGKTKAGDAGDQSPAGDPIDNAEQSPSDKNDSEGAESKSGDPGSKSSSGKNGNPANRESLLSRLKDAVSNMLSKSSKDENSSSQKNQQSAKNDSQSGEKGQAGKGQQEKGESNSDAQDGDPDSNAQNGQQAQGKLNSPTNQQAQGGSGIGNQDGSKEIKEAAQLKAMGKISEIIGQRAATVSGETSVEVQSGNQKLRTAYSTTSAAHAETDGDVTRDEIPLALQAYVQQYFAEVRKSSGPTGKKPTAKTTP
jgi:hypothetical protein